MLERKVLPELFPQAQKNNKCSAGGYGINTAVLCLFIQWNMVAQICDPSTWWGRQYDGHMF